MSRYYVYTLSNPVTGNVFYVGKGCGNRAYSHELNCRRRPDKFSVSAKDKEIQSIIHAGFSVCVSIIADKMTELDALILEEQTISVYGIENLTNVMRKGAKAGQQTPYNLGLCLSLCQAYLSMPEYFLSDRLPSSGDVNLKSIYGELDKVLEDTECKARKETLVDGFSRAIEKYNGRKFSYLPEYYPA